MRSMFRVVKINNSEKGQILRAHSQYGCFHRNSEHTIKGSLMNPLFKCWYLVEGQAPPYWALQLEKFM